MPWNLQGVDYVFDAVGGANIGPCIGALRRGGTLVGFGFMGASGTLSQLAMFANIFLGARLRGRQGKFYGITMLYRKDPKPLREDLPKIFALLAEKKIDPLVSRTFPLLEARQALELLAAGSVEGKIVLTMLIRARQPSIKGEQFGPFRPLLLIPNIRTHDSHPASVQG